MEGKVNARLDILDSHGARLLLFVCAVWLAGCQSVTEMPVHASGSESIQVVGNESFCIGITPGKIKELDLKRSSETRTRMIETVIHVLEEKGLQFRDREDTALVVNIVYNSIQKVDISNTGYSRSRDRNWDMQYPVNELSLTVNPHEEGALVIEIRTLPEKQWVWSGWCPDLNTASQMHPSRIGPLIRKILSDFNPGE